MKHANKPMKVDASMLVSNPLDAADFANTLQSNGFDGVYTFEGQHDPFLPLTVAAGATDRLELITGIAVAFGRNPLNLAHLGYDLQLASKGRFIMGLGSQVKAHIERRYSMPWSKPAARMREMVQAIHAIWDSWETGGKLNFEGEFYQHTLMMPTFSPGPNPYGKPRIFIAGIGPLMTSVAAEVGDGYFVHPFNSRAFIEQVSLPALEQGFAAAGNGKSRDDFEISCQVILATGFSDEEISQAREAARNQIAFYASTPAYKPVLEVMDRVDIQPKLTEMSKAGQWGEMAALIDDAMLRDIAVIGTPAEVAEQILESRGDLVDRISPVAYDTDTALFSAVCSELKTRSV